MTDVREENKRKFIEKLRLVADMVENQEDTYEARFDEEILFNTRLHPYLPPTFGGAHGVIYTLTLSPKPSMIVDIEVREGKQK